MKEKEINRRAYALADKLNDALGDVLQRDPQPIPVILGAANVFLASTLVNAPTKADALKTAESCFQVIRAAINGTPDPMFGLAFRQPQA